MHHATLCFLLNGKPPTHVLLGLKKVRFGQGKYAGFGGRVEPGETIEQAIVRELEEEAGIRLTTDDIQKRGQLTFVFPAKPNWSQVVHVFTAAAWQGTVTESDEMQPIWVSINNLPLNRMWQDARHWLPVMLEGKRIQGTFIFNDDNESLASVAIEVKEDDDRKV